MVTLRNLGTQITDHIFFVHFGGIHVSGSFGYFCLITSHQNTNHDSNKSARCAAEVYQKGTIRYKDNIITVYGSHARIIPRMMNKKFEYCTRCDLVAV